MVKMMGYMVEQATTKNGPSIIRAQFSGGVLIPEAIESSHFFNYLQGEMFESGNITRIKTKDELLTKCNSLVTIAFNEKQNGRSGSSWTQR